VHLAQLPDAALPKTPVEEALVPTPVFTTTRMVCLLAILADTHMPKGARRLPERCVELIATAEAVIHAGDFFAASALEEVRALCPVVHAVHGNVDEEPLRRTLPAEAEVEIAQRTVAITHDAGPAKGRLARLRRRFPAADAVVFGHSHLPLFEAEGGFQIFNPGSPTERRRAPRPSMGLLECGRAGLVFKHVWL
jgi:putative phosphoesterase